MAACAAMTPEALKTIVDLMMFADKDSVKLQAAIFIIERRYGKSVDHKEILTGPLDDASTATLLEMRRQIEAHKHGKSEGELTHDVQCGIAGDVAMSTIPGEEIWRQA